VHRSDGSGTTYIFSNYLSEVSPAWAAAVGIRATLPPSATSHCPPSSSSSPPPPLPASPARPDNHSAD